MSLNENMERSSRRVALRRLGAGGFATVLAAAGLGRDASEVRAAPLPDIILDWFGAWTSDDPPRNLAALYGADGSYEDIATGASALGPDIEQYLRAFFASLTNATRYPRTSFAVDGLAAAEQLFYATAPDGVNFLFQIYAVTIFEYDDKTILRSTDYYDSGSIMMQLGVIPAAPWFSTASNPGSAGRFCAKSG